MPRADVPSARALGVLIGLTLLAVSPAAWAADASTASLVEAGIDDVRITQQ